MRLLLSITILSALLFAGGEIRPERVKVQKPIQHNRCYKPNIQKCPDCEDVAELCPYNGEDLPEAETTPCEGLLRENQESYN